MKKLFYLCLLLPTLSFAQKHVDNQWKDIINPYFEHLDKSKIQSGILLDYAMEFTDVQAYDGVITDTTYINTNILGSIYKTLFMGKVVADTTYTPLFDRYAYNWARDRFNASKDSTGVYVLSGLLYEYQTLDEDALAQNRITVTHNKYYDKYIGGVWQNPYNTKTAFALTPPVLHSRSKDVYFKLPNELFLTNMGSQISSIQLDSDNGQGYQNLPFNNAVPLQFFENKIHDLTFKVTLTDNTVLYCRSKFKIDDPVLNQQQARGVIVVNDERVYAHEDNDFFSAAWLTIRRRPDNVQSGNITRPLIIAEGLDPGSITAPEVFGGDNTMEDFLRDVVPGGVNLGNLIDANNFNHTYDLIYIDWIRGMGDLRDNSRVLEEVIAWVNEEKVGNEPNVLLGQSMGGVIGRYTLARMENENKPHDVRLFIAHDSPMQGANTPLAFQHFSAHMKEEYVSSPILWAVGEVLIPIGLGLAQLGEDFLNAFGGNNDNIPAYVSPAQLLSLQDQTASRQLNYWSAYSTVYGNHAQTQSHSQSWQQTLETMGWPTQSRNIAISNGNECGVNNGFAPGAPLLIIDSRSNPGFLLDRLNAILAPAVGVLTLDLGLIIVGSIPGRSRWQTNLDFNSYGPTGSQNRIYRGRIRFEKKVLWIGPTINYDLTNRSYYAPQQALPFDTFSGGRFNFLDDQGNFALDIPILGDLVQLQNDFYGFIPTVSALDIRKTNGNEPTPSDYLKSYSGGIPADSNLESGFDAFIVDNLPNQPFNNEHISFQARNGNWLADELEANQPGNTFPILDDCNFICKNARVSGSNQICQNSSENYSLGGWPTDANYVWEISSPSGFTLTPSGNSVTVTPNGNVSGEVVLTVTASNNCGTATASKIIQTGAQRPIYLDAFGNEQASFTFCMLNYDGLAFDTPPGTIEWEWTNASNNFFMTASENGAQFYSASPAFGIVSVRTRDNCGWSAPTLLAINLIDCSGGGFMFNTYPNPVTNVLYIDQNNTSEATLQTDVFETTNASNQNVASSATLYNFQGNPVTSITPATGSINVSQLSPGHYILVISYGESTESHHILIE